jgi:hypothetical protein
MDRREQVSESFGYVNVGYTALGLDQQQQRKRRYSSGEAKRVKPRAQKAYACG